MQKINTILLYGLAVTLFGCGSAQKAELLSGDSPKAAISEVSQTIKLAEDEQSDLLSFKEYMAGREYLEKAELGLSRSYKKEIIVENAAIAKAYIQQSLDQANSRKSNATRILQSRKSSLQAGLRNSKPLVDELYDVDDDLRDETDNFAKALAPKEFSEFQKKYFGLEIKAVQFTKLDVLRNSIQKAIKEKADDLAPESLTTASLDLSEAMNLIAQSPRNPEIHNHSVEKSVASSVLLADVMDVILNAKGTPENIALKIVHQNRELGKLSKNVGQLQQNLKTTQSNLMQKEDVLKQQEDALKLKEDTLKRQNEQLQRSSTQIRFQQAMELAGEQFHEEEASVYQQGSKLIFRLKKINFASGTSTVPVASKPMLEKVNDIIRNLDAEMVVVQGHTDSVGASDLNQKLSTRRSISVANYLSSLEGGFKLSYIGYGESRPIVSNETKEGRAINRRVDIVVTAKK